MFGKCFGLIEARNLLTGSSGSRDRTGNEQIFGARPDDPEGVALQIVYLVRFSRMKQYGLLNLDLNQCDFKVGR